MESLTPAQDSVRQSVRPAAQADCGFYLVPDAIGQRRFGEDTIREPSPTRHGDLAVGQAQFQFVQ